MPRAGKSSIAAALQRLAPDPWINFGVDAWIAITPEHLRPGIGLRPGGERPDLEPFVVASYAALYEAVGAVSRTGQNVVVDVGHHEAYSKPLGILPDCARRLLGLPVLFVGVRCSLEEILRRRAEPAAGRSYSLSDPVLRWQDAVHAHRIYDLEVDTSLSSADECAEQILAALANGLPRPTAFERLDTSDGMRRR